MLSWIRAMRLALLLMVVAAVAANAHEGHDHGQEPQPAEQSLSPRVEASSEQVELLARLENGQLTIYLDRFRTNEPVEGASIQIETPAGPVTARADGDVYRVPAAWAAPGSHELIFTVVAGAETDLLVASLKVPNGSPIAGRNVGQWRLISSAMAQGVKQRLGGDDLTLVIVGVGGFLAGAVFMLARRRRRSAIIGGIVIALMACIGSAKAHEGEDHGPAKPDQPDWSRGAPQRDLAQRLPDSTLFVPKATQRILAIRTVVPEFTEHRQVIELPGRIIPDPNASGYVQTSVSGRLAPPPHGFPRLGTPVKAGDVLALITPPLQAIDQSDLRQRAGELDQQISIVERRIARYEQLLKSDAVARSQVEDARIELQGLRDRRAALDRVRREAEQLVAPVSGVIASANAVAGQIADPNTIVFQIVDPTKLWIEGLIYGAMPSTRAAAARTSNDRTLTLSFEGAGLADRNQAVPVHFSIKGDARGLRVGQLVTVLAETDEATQGLAIPRASVLRGPNGGNIVFEHTQAERFVSREVRITPLDGDQVLVVAGIGRGQRVVTQGAELLNQIR